MYLLGSDVSGLAKLIQLFFDLVFIGMVAFCLLPLLFLYIICSKKIKNIILLDSNFHTRLTLIPIYRWYLFLKYSKRYKIIKSISTFIYLFIICFWIGKTIYEFSSFDKKFYLNILYGYSYIAVISVVIFLVLSYINRKTN